MSKKKLKSKKCFVQKLFGQIKIGAEKIWTQNNLRSKTRLSQELIYKVWSKSCQWQLRYSWYGQMSQGQMLPEQMSLWHLEYVKKGPRNQPLKFGQNRASNSWDIADIKFAMVGGGWVCKVIFVWNPSLGLVRFG